MTSPTPVPVLVSLTTGQRLGGYAAGMVIVNISNVEIWIGSTPSVASGVGVPIQPQSSTAWQGGDLYAAVDSAAAPGTLLLSSDISDWSPSPIKTVTISGPVTVSGTVSISGTVTVAGSVAISSGTVNVGVISGTVTITGPVTVTNSPNVFPLTNLQQVLANYNAPVGAWSQNISNLGLYSALIIQAQYLPPTSGISYNLVNTFTVQGRIGGASGVVVFNQTYVQQGSVGYALGANFSNLTNGDNTFTVIPLNGIDYISISGNLGPALSSLTINVWATNALLTSNHRSQFPHGNLGGAPWLFNPGIKLASTTTSNLLIPIPVTSNPISITGFSSAVGTVGTPSTTIQIVDSLTGLRSYVQSGITKSTFVGPIVLPNSLPGQYLNVQETVAGATSQWEVMIEENQLSLAA